MARIGDTLEMLRFELKFLEDGGYGRSPRKPWRPSLVLEDSPTCLNFDDGSRPHPCKECLMMDFVPETQREQAIPAASYPCRSRVEPSKIFTAAELRLDSRTP